MSVDIDHIHRLIDELKTCSNTQELKSLQVKLTGKNGIITNQFQSLKSLTVEEKKRYAPKLTELKNLTQDTFALQKTQLEKAAILEEINQEYLDVSLPGKITNMGTIHPITVMIQEILDVFNNFGFTIIQGQEIEDQWHNFSGLNMLEHHPSRQMHDTFYLEKKDAYNKNLLLRTHTSNMQLRFMKNRKPPFKFVSYGRTYRCDSDSTHIPNFHQIESVVVGKNVNFSNMKFLIKKLLELILNKDLKIRMRPSYFPFTSPSCEIDIKLPNQNKWLEVLGCGMIDPKIMSNVGIDNSQWQGFAFGLGIERVAMIKWEITDIRQFYDGNLEWSKHNGFSFLNLVN